MQADLRTPDTPHMAPVPATRICPDGDVTEGIDVSYWQETINWNQVAADGVKFAFIRVSYGLEFYDSQFENNWAGAKANGIYRGAYQYFLAGQDAGDQAQMLLEFRMRKGCEETEVPEIHAENRNIPPSDGSTCPEQRAVSTQRNQEIDRLRFEVQGLGTLRRPFDEVLLERDIDLVLVGEAGQLLDAPGHVIVLLPSHDADAPQVGPLTHAG